MTTLFIVIGVAILLLLFRPNPRSKVIYVPIEVTEGYGDMGCLPTLAAILVILLALLAAEGLAH